MYVVSVLTPLVGIILGCIYIAREEDSWANFITGVISNVIAILLGLMLTSCSAFCHIIEYNFGL